MAFPVDGLLVQSSAGRALAINASVAQVNSATELNALNSHHSALNVGQSFSSCFDGITVIE